MTAPLVLGRYQVIRRIAVGGMGEIFLASQKGVPGFERLIILKSLLPSLNAEPGLVEQFLDEARVAALLNHPNVVAIYDVDAWEGVYFIAMEYIEGESVSQIIKAASRANTRLPFPLIAKIIHDAAMGLAHAHGATRPDGSSLKIVHRDVSPQNIMVRLDGVTKVVDFGIARATNRTTQTSAGTIKGKVQYMAPEVANRSTVDARSDQFSLGVVMWELCTRKGLFRGESDLVVLRKLLDEPIPAASAVEPSVPPELDAIAARMLERDPARRFESCVEITEVLRDYLAGHSRRASEHAVGELVTGLVGTQVRERTRDLTPSNTVIMRVLTERGENTVVGAEPTRLATKPGAEPTLTHVAPAEEPRPVAPAKRSRLWISAAAASAVAACVFLLMIALLGDEDSNDDFESTPPAVTPVLAAPRAVTTPAAPEDPPAAAAAPEPTPEPAPEPARDLAKRPRPSRPAVARERVPESGAGFLTLDTTPWTDVRIDGRPVGPTPLFKVEVAPGPHELDLVNEAAGVKARRRVVIRPGEVTKLNVDLAPE